MERVHGVTKTHLEHWIARLSGWSPHSLRMLTWLKHDVNFGLPETTSWFWNEQTSSLCAARHIDTEDTERPIYIGFFCTHPDNVEDILDCLAKELDFKRGLTFEAVEEPFWTSVTHFLSKRNECVVPFPCFKFYDDSNMTTPEAESEVLTHLHSLLATRPLAKDLVRGVVNNKEDAAMVFKYWKYAGKFAPEDILQQVPRNLILGLYKGEQLLSWIVIDESGIMAKLYTLESHRGQSLGLHILHMAVERCTETRMPALAFVEETNDASFKLFSKAGFKLASNKVAFFLSLPDNDFHSDQATLIDRVLPGHRKSRQQPTHRNSNMASSSPHSLTSKLDHLFSAFLSNLRQMDSKRRL